MQNIVEGFKLQYAREQESELSLEEYLNLAKSDPMAYASPAERMLAAIGEPRSWIRATTRAFPACFPTGPSGAIQRSRSSTAWRT